MKALYPGMGVAVVAGLLMGFAMKPELVTDGRPEGPQILTPAAGSRSTGPFDDSVVAVANYPGKVPDYVIGTDFTKVRTALASPPAPEERYVEARYTAHHDDAPIRITQASYEDMQREPVSYPSLDGGVPYPTDVPQPNVPPDTQNPPQPAEAPRL